MNPILSNAAYSIVAVVISLAAIIFEVSEGNLARRQSKIFFSLLVSTALSSAMGVWFAFSRDERFLNVYTTEYPRFFYFLFHALMAPLFYGYVSAVTGFFFKIKKSTKILIATPTIICEFILLLNPINHFMYRFDEAGKFYRGEGEIAIYITGLGYQLAAAVLLFIFWGSMTGKRRRALVYSFVLSFAGILIQLYESELRVELMFEAIALIGAQFAIEKEDDRLDSTTGFYNRYALQSDITSFEALGLQYYAMSIRILDTGILKRMIGSEDRDAVVMTVGNYLRENHRGQFIYRANPNTYVLLCPSTTEEKVSALARRIMSRFSDTWVYMGVEITLSAAMIIADSSKDFDGLDEYMILVDAEIPSKETGTILQGEKLNFMKRRVEIEKAVMAGVTGRNFEVYYQPIYLNSTRNIFAVEASLRLRHEKLGIVGPEEFMPIAVKKRMQGVLGCYRMENVCMFISSGIPRELGITAFLMTITTSQCMMPHFIDDIDEQMEKYGVSPSSFNFEFVNPEMETDPERLGIALKKLKDRGFKFSVGRTGMGSTNQQAMFAWAHDIAIINCGTFGWVPNPQVRDSILLGNIKMIRSNGRKILVKGLNTREVASFFDKLDVDYLQGDFYASPVTQSELISILKGTKNVWREEQQARAQSEAKSSFLANISHEIRTPINAILGMNEMILRETDDPEMINYAQNIEIAGNHLLTLVSDILDFSKIEAGNMELVETGYDLKEMISEVVKRCRGGAVSKGIEFSVEVDNMLPSRLKGDDMRIRQVLGNIVNNAIRYTNEGRVDFIVGGTPLSKGQIQLRFLIKDTGCGIDANTQKYLKGIFRHVNKGRQAPAEGSGLGLLIATDLMDMMHGEIDFDSDPGRGSMFGVSIPQAVEDWKEIGEVEFVEKDTHQTSKTFIAKPNARILVVDDTPLNIKVIEGLLKRTELAVDSAFSGKECIEKVHETQYDVILLDYRMPEMDGVETLKQIHESKDHPNQKTPIIVLTANVLTGAREKFLEEGFEDYLSKPVDSAKLEDMLIKYISPDKIEVRDNTEGDKAPDGPDEEILKIYWDSIETKSDDIEMKFNEGDWKNYTILVHSLKSTSRLIGETELADLAQKLENAGDAMNLDLIKAETPGLLERYRSLKAKYADRFMNTVNEDDLEDADEDMIKDAFDSILNFAEMMDFENLTFVLDELKKYRFSESDKALIEKIREQADMLEWDEVANLARSREGGDDK